MRNVLALIAACSLVAVASADFSGPADPSNWTFTAAGSGTGSLNTTTMVVTGDDSGLLATFNNYSISGLGDISFDWSYSSLDYGAFDTASVVVNGVTTVLSDNDGLPSGFSGSFAATGASNLQIGVNSTDGVFGAGTLTVTNFSTAAPLAGDLNGDGCVDQNDLNILLANFLQGNCP